MNTFISYVNELAAQIKDTEKNVTTEELMNEIIRTRNERFANLLYTVIDGIKLLVRYTGVPTNENNEPLELSDEERECRSLLLSYNKNENTFELVFSQFEKIKSNGDAIKFIQKSDRRKTYEYCYDGTLITTLWSHKEKRFVHMTRSCDAYKSYWQKMSYGDLFDDALTNNKILFNPKNEFYEKDCHYFSVLVDYRNKNIVDYSNKFGQNYSKVVFVAKRKNGTVVDADVDEKELASLGFYVPEKLNFDNIESVLNYLEELDRESLEQKQMLHEGVIIKAFDENNKYVVCKIQTNEFNELKKILPNSSNPWIKYLELYRRNTFKEYMESYDITIDKSTLKVINSTFLNLVTELTKVYFKTRNNNNPSLYKSLPKSFHQALYEIHGLYIKKKQNLANKPKNNNMEEKVENDLNITPMDVNVYLRAVNVELVGKLIVDRIYLIDALPEQYYQSGIINVGSRDSYVMARNLNDDSKYIDLLEKYQNY
jgi:hypothetical protein